MTEVFFVFTIQCVLLYTLFIETGLPEDSEPPDIKISLTRLFTGLMMQIKMEPELKHALNKMKYVLNHPWKFEYPCGAALSGLF